MPLFMSNAQNAITNLESQINTEMSYMSIQFSSITSVAVYDINMAVSDISKLLNSLYTFSQKSIEILLSSPVLQMLPMLNPMAMMVAGVIASDPVLMISNYTAWQSQYSSRQSLVSNNFNTMYTMVSTGLPQIENVLLSLMTRISMLADHLTIHLPTGTDLTRSLMNESFARQITAALAGIDGISELPGLDAESNELHAALQSAAFYHLHTGDITAQSTHDDDGVFNTPTPTSAV
ncbi:hypothetical protein EV175_000334 [Coemansia sp. RSA 1933]|nr:hypothetical protein EV175_000334 [Coemansia sp. RSA 1933]